MRRSSLLLAVLLLGACDSDEDGGRRERLRLEPQLRVYTGNYERVGLALDARREEGGGGVPDLYALDGLAFRWGVRQTVEVRVERLPPMPDALTQTHYVLERVLSEEPVARGTPFTLRFATWSPQVNGRFIARTGPQGMTIGASSFACASEAACEAVEARAAGSAPFVIEGAHTAPDELPLLTRAR